MSPRPGICSSGKMPGSRRPASGPLRLVGGLHASPLLVDGGAVGEAADVVPGVAFDAALERVGRVLHAAETVAHAVLGRLGVVVTLEGVRAAGGAEHLAALLFVRQPGEAGGRDVLV